MLDNVSKIIESICAVGNLALLVYFTRKEWKHTREREELERKKSWYDKLVIDRTINLIVEFFEKTEKILSKPCDSSQREEKVLKIRAEGKHYKGIIIPYIETISVDLSKKINELFVEYNDFITQEAEKNRTNVSFAVENKINKKRTEILKVIYEFDFEHNL